MIRFLTTQLHAYTHEKVAEESKAVEVGVLPYELAARDKELPRGTYIFTDIDRLAPIQLRWASGLYRRLRDRGCRVLNDPARLHSRYGLLRLLFRNGLNRFDCYRAEECVRPERWPVFLRVEGDHDRPVSPLLADMDQLRRAMADAIAGGAPISSLLIIEYAAEPVQPGLFRKLATFRVGQESVPHCCVHQDTWLVKYGKVGSATPELYEDDRRIVRDDPWRDRLARVFELADVEYGRADFGLVGGEPQVYEINTNPNVKFGGEHPSPVRVDSYRIFKENYLRALATIDS